MIEAGQGRHPVAGPAGDRVALAEPVPVVVPGRAAGAAEGAEVGVEAAAAGRLPAVPQGLDGDGAVSAQGGLTRGPVGGGVAHLGTVGPAPHAVGPAAHADPHGVAVILGGVLREIKKQPCNSSATTPTTTTRITTRKHFFSLPD